MRLPTQIALGVLGLWLIARVRAISDLKARSEFPARGAVDRDSIHPDEEDRAVVDQFRDMRGNLL